jgi:hypothetical protein
VFNQLDAHPKHIIAIVMFAEVGFGRTNNYS